MKKIFSFCRSLLLLSLSISCGVDLPADSQTMPAGDDPGQWTSLMDSSWREVFGDGVDGHVLALAVVGSDLYVGGDFTTADGQVVNHVAKWDGFSWASLGAGVNGQVRAIAVYHGDIYVGGTISNAGGVPVANIARWDGATWSSPGAGVNGPVHSLAAFGGALVAGGDFSTAGGYGVNNIARWNGAGWYGMDGGANCGVFALATDDANLYAGGAFSEIGGILANYVARWDGFSWNALHGGVDAPVMALAVRGDPFSGGYLYAGGYFTYAGGVKTNHLARWNGSYWWGLDFGTNRVVRALSTDDSVLYAGGWFSDAGGSPKSYVARFKGTHWSDLSGGMNAPVHALVVSGTRIYAGGEFDTAGSIRTPHIGLWTPDTSAVFEPPAKVRISLNVSTGVSSRDLIFGVRSGAARGIWGVDPAAGVVDSIEGEAELPPPIPGIFDARFTYPAGDFEIFGGGSWVDFRNFDYTTQADTFRVEFQPGSTGYPVLISWSKTAIQNSYIGDVTLTAIGGSSYDMKAVDSVVITDDVVDQLFIVADGPNLSVLYHAGWNLISIPNDVPDGSKSILFPWVSGRAFAFDNIQGYQSRSVLEPGIGYWLKFPAVVHSLSFDGPERISDSVEVETGWNLIGSISVPTPVASITSDPPGMITGNFFGYDNIFKEVSVLEPMRGYWVKATQNGQLFMSGAGSYHPGNAIRIIPDGELPPPPPSPDADEGREVVTEFRLDNVYPNPFNPVAHIDYALPVDSWVTLTVYNVFGQVVTRLLDETRSAGTQSIQWDASSVASGVYFCRMEAASLSVPVNRYFETRKMVLIK